VLNIPQFPDTSPISQMTDILDDSYESDLTEEEHERLILMSEHAIAKPLSSAAQAVLAAYRSSHLSINNLAAALRTLAEKSGRAFLTIDGEPAQGADYISVADVLAIADELEQAYFGELND
jgi:hypothetical protein